ncbi:MAG: hypothetical protein KDC18_11420 [Alphaproteobacteria bacterium]|nr:hypothetical protein [Alphaproteobacteria bacterium]MCB9928978.1 hypothetical protein [Alphaproteobacteria bacterium]
MITPIMDRPMCRSALIGAAIAIGLAAPAQAITLTNGTGPGSVTVDVDGYGSFGLAVGGNGTGDAFYTPVGSASASGTTFESGVYLSGPGTFLTTGSIRSSGGLPDLVVQQSSPTSATSSFQLGSLDFRLTQTLVSSFDGSGTRIGSQLNQSYRITNTASVPNSFALKRYLDGDLEFDESIADGGGIITLGGNQVLFETDSADSPSQSTTFVGITANGGDQSPPGRFEVSSYSGLGNKVAVGGTLNDTVAGDTNGDGFIDNAYDVTLAFNNNYSLAAGETATYLTQTLFGNAVPPAPGSSESLPLLPGNNEPPFVFDITVDSPDTPLWLDPVVTTGFDYAIQNLLFASVTMPSLATVPDMDGYELLIDVGGTLTQIATLMAGESYTFGSPVDFFSVQGIDPSLMLDPNNAMAFPVAVTFNTIGSGQITITPIGTNIPASGVPVPATLVLLVPGLLGLGMTLRRRRRA